MTLRWLMCRYWVQVGITMGERELVCYAGVLWGTQIQKRKRKELHTNLDQQREHRIFFVNTSSNCSIQG